MPKTPKILMWVDVETNYGRGIVRGIAKYSSLFGPWTFYIEPPFFSEIHSFDAISTELVKKKNVNAVIMPENKYFKEN